jgi:hypothetical protein
MELAFIIITIFVIIATININLSFSVQYDILKNIGNISIRLFGIPIFKSEVSLIAGYFNLIRKNKKVLQIKVDINDKNLIFLNDVSSYFTKKLIVTCLDSDFSVSGYDPATVSIFAGYITVIEGVIRSYIACKSPDTTISNNISVKFKESGFQFKIKANVIITLFDFVWAIIRATIKRSVYGKAKVRRNSQFNY